MKKLLKIASLSLVGLMMIPSLVFAEGKVRTFEKTYEVQESGNTYTFYVENSVGNFDVSVTMPNGFVTDAKVTKISDGDNNIYRAKFRMNNAPEGEYVFEIKSEHASYFNLIVKTNLFLDLNNHWAEDDINKFYDKGIISGYNDMTFKPDTTVTGEQFIKMMVLSLTEENPSGKRQYIDSLRFNATEGKDRESIMNAEYDLSQVDINNWFESYYKVIKDTSLLDKFTNDAKETVVVLPLKIDGAVTHTEEWEKNRVTWNNSNPSAQRAENVFFAGEGFVLTGKPTVTSNAGGSTTVASRVDVVANLIGSTGLAKETAAKWTGYLGQENASVVLEQLDDGAYDFVFTVTFSNGVKKTDTVRIYIKDNWTTYLQFHKQF